MVLVSLFFSTALVRGADISTTAYLIGAGKAAASSLQQGAGIVTGQISTQGANLAGAAANGVQSGAQEGESQCFSLITISR